MYENEFDGFIKVLLILLGGYLFLVVLFGIIDDIKNGNNPFKQCLSTITHNEQGLLAVAAIELRPLEQMPIKIQM